MLVEVDLANALHNALRQKKDGNGAPTPVSTETQEYASGFIASVKTGIVSHAPGTITGVTAPGAPLVAGAGLGGVIVIASAALMIAKTSNGIPKAPDIAKENTAVIAYVTTGLVTFAPGNITGTCTSTAMAPGPLTVGAGSMGTIVGLTGAGCLAAVGAAGVPIGPDAIKHYTALIDYLLANAEVTYAPGAVVGVCPVGGGPLAGGTGVGGTIS